MLLQKTMHRKNNVPQILPPLIALKIFGSVIKIRLGPVPGSLRTQSMPEK